MRGLRYWAVLPLILLGMAAAGPACRADAGPELHDFSGSGTIQISVPGSSLTIGFEQAYVAPEAYLFEFDLNLVRQWSLVIGDRERTYSGGEPFAVEKQYHNLSRLPSNPSLAAQMSMTEFSRIIRDVKQLQTLGTQTLLNQPCSIARFSNKELIGILHSRGLVGDDAAKLLEKGVTKVWLVQGCGLPAKIQIADSEGNPAIVFSFSQLKINSGLKITDLHIPVPRAAVWLTVTPDVSVPRWQEICDAEIRKQLEALEKQQQQPQQQRGRRGRS